MFKLARLKEMLPGRASCAPRACKTLNCMRGGESERALLEALRSTGGEVPDSAVAEASGVVVACSALKRSYRDRLRARAPHTVFVHLTGDPELLSARALARTGHFMPPALLASQLATLEPLGDDEAGVVVDVTEAVATVAERAVGWVQREGSE